MATVPYQLPRILIVIMLLAAISSPAFAAQRVALVVGNGAYAHTKTLKNPKNDAEAVAEALEALEFEVIKGIDLDRSSFFDKLKEFNRAASEAEVALFFYAGHGLQALGENFLVPIDAKVEEEVDLFGAVRLHTILHFMRSETNLVFLDACRDNPMVDNLTRSLGKSRSSEVSRGLKRVEVAKTDKSSTLIAFATAPGKTAKDGTGLNSPYTRALLEHIATPELSIGDMLIAVNETVRDRTGGQQQPWVSGSVAKNFFFNPKDPAEEAYEQAVLAGTAAALEKVIEDHPESEFAEKARKRKEELRAREQPAQLAQVIQSAVTEGATQGERIVNERVFFNLAMESRDPMNLQAYLNQYSEGEFVPLAKNELRKLLREASDPSVLHAFLSAYPESRFAGLARFRLKRSIENSTDPGELDIYLASFSDSEFVEQVQNRLKQLDASSTDASEGEAREPAAPEPQEASPEPVSSRAHPGTGGMVAGTRARGAPPHSAGAGGGGVRSRLGGWPVRSGHTQRDREMARVAGEAENPSPGRGVGEEPARGGGRSRRATGRGGGESPGRAAGSGRQTLELRQEQREPGRLRQVPHGLSARTLPEASPPAQGGAARGAKGGRQTLELRQEQREPGRLRQVPHGLSARTLPEASPPAQGGAARGAKGGRQTLELRQEQPEPDPTSTGTSPPIRRDAT